MADRLVERYDRQVRVLSHMGQDRLTQASILVVGDIGLSAEVLKNLILSGISQYMVIDGAQTEAMLSQLAGPGTRCMAPASKLPWYHPTTLQVFTVLVIALSTVSDSMRSHVSSAAQWMLDHNRLVVELRTLGLVGYLSCLKLRHLVLDTHGPSHPAPFFITDPFPDLEAFYIKEWSKAISSQHIAPYPVYLYHCYKEWKKIPDPSLKTQKSKDSLTQFINNEIRAAFPDSSDLLLYHLNPYIHRIWTEARLQSHFQSLIAVPTQYDPQDPVHAIFMAWVRYLSVNSHHLRPFDYAASHLVPDMPDCDPEAFLTWARLLHQRHKDTVQEQCSSLLPSLPHLDRKFIEQYISHFIQHFLDLQWFCTKTINWDTQLVAENDILSIYDRLRASSDAPRPHGSIVVDSILGSVASQEIIKYCTGHYVPLTGDDSSRQLLLYQAEDISLPPFTTTRLLTFQRS